MRDFKNVLNNANVSYACFYSYILYIIFPIFYCQFIKYVVK